MGRSPKPEPAPRVTRLMRLQEVEEITGLGRAEIVARAKNGTFPRPVMIGQTKTWPDNEVVAWVAPPPEPAPPRPRKVVPIDQCNHPLRDEPTCLYRHWSASGELLYIGISLSAVDRLAGHRSDSPWFREIARIDIEWHDTRLAAMRAERDAIRAECPKYNKSLVAA